MPAYSIDPNDPKAIARLLITLVLQNDGELRIKGCDYDSIDKGYALLVEYDKINSTVVLRATSGKIMLVPAENAAWTRQREEVPREQVETRATQEARQRVLRSDEELAEYEERLNQRTALAREVAEGKGTKFRTVPPSTQA